MWHWVSGSELYHYGVKGMKWGKGRYYNPDGTLTALGRQRYGIGLNGHSRTVVVGKGAATVSKGKRTAVSNTVSVPTVKKKATIVPGLLKNTSKALGVHPTLKNNKAKTVPEEVSPRFKSTAPDRDVTRQQFKSRKIQAKIGMSEYEKQKQSKQPSLFGKITRNAKIAKASLASNSKLQNAKSGMEKLKPVHRTPGVGAHPTLMNSKARLDLENSPGHSGLTLRKNRAELDVARDVDRKKRSNYNYTPANETKPYKGLAAEKQKMKDHGPAFSGLDASSAISTIGSWYGKKDGYVHLNSNTTKRISEVTSQELKSMLKSMKENGNGSIIDGDYYTVDSIGSTYVFVNSEGQMVDALQYLKLKQNQIDK